MSEDGAWLVHAITGTLWSRCTGSEAELSELFVPMQVELPATHLPDAADAGVLAEDTGWFTNAELLQLPS